LGQGLAAQALKNQLHPKKESGQLPRKVGCNLKGGQTVARIDDQISKKMCSTHATWDFYDP
jgi:hypothetical protein